MYSQHYSVRIILSYSIYILEILFVVLKIILWTIFSLNLKYILHFVVNKNFFFCSQSIYSFYFLPYNILKNTFERLNNLISPKLCVKKVFPPQNYYIAI